jgi:hypothetical protein
MQSSVRSRFHVAGLPLDRLDRKVTASVGGEAKAGIGEESPTSGKGATRGGRSPMDDSVE